MQHALLEIRRHRFVKSLPAASLALATLTLAATPLAITPASGQPNHAASDRPNHPERGRPNHTGGVRPNILYLVADDLGYSDLGAFGSEIRTPNIDQLARHGRILTNFHASTVCAVTRAMLYSGTDHHLVGLGTMGVPNDERRGLPGYEGYLNDRALSVAQLLQNGGYHTYIAGKWHLGSDISKGQTPNAWGFERSYTLLGGATVNHFGHEKADSKSYATDGRYVQPGQPGQPGEDGTPWYDTDFYTDKLIEFIDSNHGDGKPFAAFGTYTSPHWPLQVPDEYLNRYAGRYNAGYDAIRARRLLRQKALGIIPAGFEANPGLPNALTASEGTPNNGTADAKYINAENPNPPDGDPSYVDYGPGRVNKKWSSLTADEKRLQARYMEIYAAMVENLDYNVGRLIRHLKEIGEYDNTLIIFHSDNGAEGWPLSASQEATNQANFASLGKSGSNVQYGLRWAEVSATPFKLLKGFTAEGGTSVPAIVRLPGQTKQLPILRDFIHVRDAAPTLLEAAGIEPPTTPAPPAIDDNGVDRNGGQVVYDGRNVYPITGLSFLAALEGRQRGPVHTEPVGDEQYGRGYLVKGRWKALFVEPPWGPTDGHWQLYDIVADRGEVHDVAAFHSRLIRELKQDWDDYLQGVGGVEPLRPKGYF